MPAALATIEPAAPRAPRGARTSLTLQQSIALDRNGRIETEPGAAIVRPLRDHDTDAPPDTPKRPALPTVGRLLTEPELAAARDAAAPLALLESKQRERDDEWRMARSMGELAKLPAIEQQADDLKRQHQTLRARDRMGILNANDAAMKRAGAKWSAACAMAAAAAAELQGLAEHRDELLGRNDFDAFGAWQRMGLLAAPLAYRPGGSTIVSDVFGRDCHWSADSAAHREAVRRVKLALRSEFSEARANAAWPF